MLELPDVRHAVDQLSTTGGLHNCDPESWSAYLGVEAMHRDALDTEFVHNVDRAKWAMTLHRSKKSSLDRAVGRMFAKATRSGYWRKPLSRPLIIGVGDASFPCGGPRGELPAPTSQLSKALQRAAAAERRRGRRVELLSIDEARTTMCCCACGAVTTAPAIKRRKTDPETGQMVVKDDPSRRLRCCITCLPTGKLRDRDVQAARNILWLTTAAYYGLPRPQYLTRGWEQPQNTG